MATKKITGRVIQRKGIWYAVINLKDEDGKPKPKWVSTKLKGDEHEEDALKFLDKELEKYNKLFKNSNTSKDTRILFADYLYVWLEYRKNGSLREEPLKENTYADYKIRIDCIMYPYFKEKRILLSELTEDDIIAYYDMLRLERGNCNNTINKHHATINSTLKYAVKQKHIDVNPAAIVGKASTTPRPVKYYNLSTLQKLFSVVKGTPFELFVLLGATSGLRRCEILGLKWKAIDFKNDLIMIEHTVTEARYKGKTRIIKQDTCKTKKSTRALPLIPVVKDLLFQIKEQQKKDSELCGDSYYYEDNEYVCRDKLGHLVKPGYVSQHFSILLEANGLPHIRFHDLRHSCAGAMLSQGKTLKVVQEYLGHSSYVTTDLVYGHLEMASKIDASHVFYKEHNNKRYAETDSRKS